MWDIFIFQILQFYIILVPHNFIFEKRIRVKEINLYNAKYKFLMVFINPMRERSGQGKLPGSDSC